MKKRLMLLLCVPFLLASCSNKNAEPTNNNQTQQTGENTGNTDNQSGDNGGSSGNQSGNSQSGENGGNSGNQGGNTEARTFSDISIEGYTASFKINEEFSIGGLKVFALYSNGEKEEVTDYTVDSSKYNKQVSGDYEIVITYSGKSKTYNVSVTTDGKTVEFPFV